ncbi:MAG: TonB-dependent receptor plug domain-containing protein [Tannerella sp.]|jgi:TonB-dependent SusC/RagA subfamily outer membrane receptor|nr:TonB-dependent receptor plug domain-containing protein [Tannerella sp.]
MEAFRIYSLKAAIILILFWGIYRLFLQKETFYRFNRFFLLTGLIAASVLPSVIIRYAVEINTSPVIPIHIITETNIPSAVEANARKSSAFITFYNLYLPVIYLVVVCIMLIVKTVGLSRLFRTIRRNNGTRYTNYTLIESSEFEGSFSFFRFVFIPQNLTESEKKIILKHEEAHIIQKHWIDLFLSNIVSLIWWFNPVIRLYEKAIRSNHEYLADQEVLTDYEQTDYQQTLVNQWFKTPVFPIVNSFSYSNRLKRINMMKKNISNPLKKIFALLVLPGICLFLWSFSEPEYIVKNNKPSSEKDIFMDNTLTTDNAIEIKPLQNEANAMLKPTETINTKTTNNIGKEQSPKEMKPENNDTTHISNPTKLGISDLDSILVIIDGVKEKDGLKTLKPENIESISVLKNQASIKHYGEEGRNGVILVTTKKSPFGKADTVHQKEQPGAEKDPEIKIVGYGSMNDMNNDILKLPPLSKPVSPQSPLYIIDGIKKDSLHNINPENIASISVLKDNSAIEIYGKEAKNGVVLITTKEGRKTAFEKNSYEIKGVVLDESGKPIRKALVKITDNDTYTDNNGEFSLHIVPGDWLQVFAESYSKKTVTTEQDQKQTFFQIILIKE